MRDRSSYRKRVFLRAWIAAFILVAAVVSGAESALAYIHSLPTSLEKETLSESVPTAFAPERLSAEDFALEWVGEPIPELEASIGKESFEWVRVAEVLVLPRARLMLYALNAEGGHVQNAGFTQPFAVQDGTATAELPVALLSGPDNAIEVRILREGREFSGRIKVKFRPRRQSPEPRIYTDPSCSPFGVEGVGKNISPDEWIYVGCRQVYVEGTEKPTNSLEVYVYWDGAGDTLEIGGLPARPTLTSLWALRLRSRPSQVTLKSGDRELKLQYFIPERAHRAFVGAGIGPYAYIFTAPGASTNQIVPVLTLYAGYFISETTRLVAFDATPLHNDFFTDFGIYVTNESARVIDRRLSLNIMLGAHVLSFMVLGKPRYQFSAPQGFELIFRDALLKGSNFAFGAFIYPLIDGQSYHNVWVRWGKGRFFAEFNYIGWHEKVDEGPVFSRSVGVCVGFPIARFL